MSGSTTGATHCPHISVALSDEQERERILQKCRKVAAWDSQRRSGSSPPVKRRRVAVPACGTCQQTLSRPLACLHCSYCGCWREGHAKAHLVEAQHTFYADAKTGAIYCLECDDFVQHNALSEAFSAASIAAEEIYTLFQVAKRGREPFRRWAPNSEEEAALGQATALPCQGLRGLLNLGQTCFMNVILQSFIFNPLLRNYFLSDKHNHKLCKTANCTCCEMDKLFGEIFSDSGAPYGPTSFLSTTWRASSELSGYAQQDAHEFFLSALNQIHATTRGSTKLSCICIVHSTFEGQLQSDVKCERCGNVTTVTEPTRDISLDIKDAGAAGQELTLMSCLKKYTQPERLASKDYSCANCGKTSHDTSKRLSLRKLSPVLSFQFKRFEHNTGDKSAARKIEARVRFPAVLNMAPYTTLGMDKHEREAKGAGAVGDKHTGPDAMYEYDLFCVVCHEGQIDNGHYTCYARSQDEWYRFDDDKVTHSSLRACLDSQAYMCFYVKRHLDYMPYMTPSYKVAREAEAVREREKEAARMKEVEDALLATV